MTKEKTALVIPNAIQMVTNNEKFFFTSFTSRDKAYVNVFKLWQNALLDQVRGNEGGKGIWIQSLGREKMKCSEIVLGWTRYTYSTGDIRFGGGFGR